MDHNNSPTTRAKQKGALKQGTFWGEIAHPLANLRRPRPGHRPMGVLPLSRADMDPKLDLDPTGVVRSPIPSTYKRSIGCGDLSGCILCSQPSTCVSFVVPSKLSKNGVFKIKPTNRMTPRNDVRPLNSLYINHAPHPPKKGFPSNTSSKMGPPNILKGSKRT